MLLLYLEGSRNEDEAVRAEVLHPSRVDAHEVDDVAAGALGVVAKEERLLVHCRDQTCSDAHARQEAEVEVLHQCVSDGGYCTRL